MKLYKAEEKDTYAALSRRFLTDEEALRAANGAESGEPKAGELLLVPFPTRSTEARRGETTETIARRTGKCKDDLLRKNPALCHREARRGERINLDREDEVRGGFLLLRVDSSAQVSSIEAALPFVSAVSLDHLLIRDGKLHAKYDPVRLFRAIRRAGIPVFLGAAGEARSADDAVLRMTETGGYAGILLSGAPGEKMKECGLPLILENGDRSDTSADFVILPALPDGSLSAREKGKVLVSLSAAEDLFEKEKLLKALSRDGYAGVTLDAGKITKKELCLLASYFLPVREA